MSNSDQPKEPDQTIYQRDKSAKEPKAIEDKKSKPKRKLSWKKDPAIRRRREYTEFIWNCIEEGDIRYDSKLGGGFLNDSGCYPINASRMIFEEEPIGVSSSLSIDVKTGVDISGTSYIVYKNGKTASITYGNGNYYQSKYSVWGSKAKISTKRAYAVPQSYTTSVFLHKNDEIVEKTVKPTDQFGIMCDIFCNVITKKIINPYDFENDLLDQAKLMEAIRISDQENRIVLLSEFK